MIKTIILSLLFSLANSDGVIEFSGLWGEWGKTYKAASRYYACGVLLRFDFNRQDKTSVNGIEMRFCDSQNWNIQKTFSFPGDKGDWYYDKYVACPKNSYIYGFSVKFQDSQGSGDDTAVNGFQFICMNPRNNYLREVIHTPEGYYGQWKNWLFAPTGEYVTSFQTRYENPVSADNTGLNGIRFTTAPYANPHISHQTLRPTAN